MSHADIESSSYSALLDLIEEMHQCRSLRQLEYLVTEDIASVIPADCVTYNKIDLTGNLGGSKGIFRPEFHTPEEIGPLYDRWMHQNPLVEAFRATGDGAPRRMSDFIDMNEFKLTEMYRLVFEPMHSLHQIAFAVVELPGLVIGIGINRETQDFTDAELAMAHLIYRQLPPAFHHVQLREIHEGDLQLQSVPNLTDREREILSFMRVGMSNQNIARTLHLGKRTVEKHLQHLYAKLGVNSRTAAVNAVWPPLFD